MRLKARRTGGGPGSTPIGAPGIMASWIREQQLYDLILSGVQAPDDLDGQLPGPAGPWVSVIPSHRWSWEWEVTRNRAVGFATQEFGRAPPSASLSFDLAGPCSVSRCRSGNPRYVSDMRIRLASMGGGIEEVPVDGATAGSGLTVRGVCSRPRRPVGRREIAAGPSPDESGRTQILGLLRERGLIRLTQRRPRSLGRGGPAAASSTPTFELLGRGPEDLATVWGWPWRAGARPRPEFPNPSMLKRDVVLNDVASQVGPPIRPKRMPGRARQCPSPKFDPKLRASRQHERRAMDLGCSLSLLVPTAAGRVRGRCPGPRMTLVVCDQASSSGASCSPRVGPSGGTGASVPSSGDRSRPASRPRLTLRRSRSCHRPYPSDGVTNDPSGHAPRLRTRTSTSTKATMLVAIGPRPQSRQEQRRRSPRRLADALGGPRCPGTSPGCAISAWPAPAPAASARSGVEGPAPGPTCRSASPGAPRASRRDQGNRRLIIACKQRRSRPIFDAAQYGTTADAIELLRAVDPTAFQRPLEPQAPRL